MATTITSRPPLSKYVSLAELALVKGAFEYFNNFRITYGADMPCSFRGLNKGDCEFKHNLGYTVRLSVRNTVTNHFMNPVSLDTLFLFKINYGFIGFRAN